MNEFGKILVTGASGFLGSRVVNKLMENGADEVRCLVRSGSNLSELNRIQKQFTKLNLDLHQGDLTCIDDACTALEGVGLIIHCAVAKNVPFAQSFLNTVVATRNLVNAATNCENLKRFVHVSSFAVYDVESLLRGDTVNEETPVEKNHIRRNDGYSYVKCKQEELLFAAQNQTGLPVVIVRPGVVYGPGGDEMSRRVGVQLPGLYLNIGNKNFMPITYVDNCADAIVLAAKTDGVDGQVINIHDDKLCTCNEFLSGYRSQVNKIRTLKVPYSIFWWLSWLYDKYCNYSNGQLPEVFSPCKTANTWKTQNFDNHKLKTVLGWQQNIPTHEGLSRHYRHYKERFSQDSRA